MVWQAGGNDIYYQGKTDKQLPVTTQITYTLDGKQMQPDQLAGKNGEPVILDSSELAYISSAGLRTIRNLYILLYKKGGKLMVTNVNDNVMEVFEMTGLAGLLNIR